MFILLLPFETPNLLLFILSFILGLTIDAFYEANMDLVAVSPEFNLYDTKWPIRTRARQRFWT